MASSAFTVCSQRQALGARPTFAPLPVVRATTRTSARRAAVARSSSSQAPLAVPAAVTAAVIATMSHPLVAEAAVTPSLKNLLNSVVAGSILLGVIAGAITFVSNFDPISRR